jgi:hypothetical protein
MDTNFHNQVLLNFGYSINDLTNRKLYIRQLNGYDEQFLRETKKYFSTLYRIKNLLSKVISVDLTPIAGNDKYLNTIVNDLTIGDLQILVLHLRKLIFGDKIQTVIKCPICNLDMDLNVSTFELLTRFMICDKANYEQEVKIDKYLVKIRPLKISDIETCTNYNFNQSSFKSLESSSSSSESSESTDDNNKKNYVEQLIRRCIIQSIPDLPSNCLDNEFLEQINEEIGKVDPFADILLDLKCPECGSSFGQSFVIFDFFLKEMDLRDHNLEKEIHWLAFHYHWTEDAILALPIWKRKRYIDLINDTLRGGRSVY